MNVRIFVNVNPNKLLLSQFCSTFLKKGRLLVTFFTTKQSFFQNDVKAGPIHRYGVNISKLISFLTNYSVN